MYGRGIREVVTEDAVLKIAGCFRQFAFDPRESRGRRRLDDYDLRFGSVLNPYHVDIGKIQNSKALRRLSIKTQVFASPSNQHVRTRGSHTLEVVAIAKDIAAILGLNLTLSEAIALGHDIGHAPIGHVGEEVISELASLRKGAPVHFRHEKFGVVVAEEIERSGAGLNLTLETLQGILNHSRGMNGLVADSLLPYEYGVVMMADKIAYTFSDLSDLPRYYLEAVKWVPAFVKEIGFNQREQVQNCVFALAQESEKVGCISFNKSSLAHLFEELRQWLYKYVYKELNSKVQRDALVNVYKFLESCSLTSGCDPALVLALMTDLEVIELSTCLLTMPQISEEVLRMYDFWELLPTLRGKEINYEVPDLSWAGS